MSTVKIKQVEGLRSELDGKAEANTVEGKANAFTETSEQFTNLTFAANAEGSVTLTKLPKVGFVLEVYFNGVRLQSFTTNAKVVKYTVPYSTEASDEILVRYCY